MECSSGQMIMAVVMGNFITILILALIAIQHESAKKKKKDDCDK